MRILIVEDCLQDVDGILVQCNARHWKVDIAKSCFEAAVLLDNRQNHFDVVIIDIMLPWGAKAPTEVPRMFSDENTGLFLLEAMRGINQGVQVTKAFGLNKIAEHQHTPVIVLSKINDLRDRCNELGIVEFYSKIEYSYRDLIRAIEKIEQHSEK